MFAGTSIGGITALGLSYGVPTEKIVPLFSTEADKIFVKNSLFRKTFYNKYESDGLREQLTNFFGQK